MTPTVFEFVVPYAGPGDLLRETVTSVLRQTDPGWTLTVVEDGDQDPTVASWIREIDDPRVRYERNGLTLGVAGNFQHCLDIATGDFVVFPGSDDRLLPSYLSEIRRAIAAFPEAGVVHPGVRVIDGEGEPTRTLGDGVKALLRPSGSGVRELGGERLLSSLMRGNWAYFPALCWNRSKLGELGFRQDLSTVLDLEVLSRLVLSGATMALCDEVVFEYRRHAASASSRSRLTDRFDEEARVMREMSALASGAGWDVAARAARWRPSSRLHAALLVAPALARSQWGAARSLVTSATSA